MAGTITLKDRIEYYTGDIDLPDYTAHALQYLKDGIKDTVSKIFRWRPEYRHAFTNSVAIATGDSVLPYLAVEKVIIDGVSARRIDPLLAEQAADSASIHYATANDPVYWILDGKVYFFPIGTTRMGNFITYDSSATLASYGIGYMPGEMDNIPILYTAIRVLMLKLEAIREGLPIDVDDTITDNVFNIRSDSDSYSTVSANITQSLTAEYAKVDTYIGYAGALTTEYAALKAYIDEILVGDVLDAVQPKDIITNFDSSLDLLTGDGLTKPIDLLLDEIKSASNLFTDDTMTQLFASVNAYIDTAATEDPELSREKLGEIQQKISQLVSNINSKLQRAQTIISQHSTAIQANVGLLPSILNATISKVSEYNKNLSLKVQHGTSLANIKIGDIANRIQQLSSEIQGNIGKSALKLQDYNASVNKDVQLFNLRLNKDTINYKWLQEQLSLVKSEYKEAMLQYMPVEKN